MKVTAEYDDGTVATYDVLRADRRKNTDGTTKLCFRGRLQQHAPKPSPQARVADMDGRITRTETLLANCIEEIGALRARLQRLETKQPAPRKVVWRPCGSSRLLYIEGTKRVGLVSRTPRGWFWRNEERDVKAADETDAKEKAFRKAIEVHGPLELVR